MPLVIRLLYICLHKLLVLSMFLLVATKKSTKYRFLEEGTGVKLFTAHGELDKIGAQFTLTFKQAPA